MPLCQTALKIEPGSDCKQTLRNQLVGVMRKTGTRRQSELVLLLTRLALTCL